MVSRNSVVSWLTWTIPALVTLHFASAALHHFFPTHGTGELVRLFSVDAEGNLPTWFSSSILASTAFCCLLAGRKREELASRPFWIALGMFTLWVSMDETAQLHDRLPELIAAKLGYRTDPQVWVLVLPVLAAALWRPGARLWRAGDRRMRIRIGQVAACYSVAALMEAVNWAMLAWAASSSLSQLALPAVEESAELLAAVLLFDLASSRLPVTD